MSVSVSLVSGDGDDSADSGDGHDSADSLLVRERGARLVEAFGGKRDCCWSGRQATTILHITLEVANSKAKSEGIQIYCYK